ncbi:MAG: N-acetylneuraminate synthase [Candidatus Omnitrophica bacterium]|nr:N-acetylneuraminate synthase [Candidatus Omnitrophota bacterium]
MTGRQVTIIAEIGENHIGSMDLAEKMIFSAAEAGADIVKFQSYRPENFKQDDPEYDWFEKVSLTDEDHFELKKRADEAGVEFMSAPFSRERARFLCEELGLKKIKVASGMMTDRSLLSYLNGACEEVYLSTGMATLKEIRGSLALLDKVKVSLLHCVTQYPLKDEDANLLAVGTLKQEFGDLTVGYSDHTVGTLACLVAVSLGARIIEKHFTLDKNAPEGTDHVLSATPVEFGAMVRQIRSIPPLMGDGEKVPRACEEEIKDFVRNRFQEG